MINTITISGNLAQDPEVRLGKNLNESYVTFSLCIHFYNGEEYVKCIAGGKTADYLIKNAKKGDHVGVTGKIRLNRWTNRNGEEVQELGISVSDADWSPKGAVANQQQSQQSQVPQNNYGGQSIRIVQQLIREHVKAISRGRIRMSRMMSTVNLFRHILITMKQRGDKSAEKSQ